MREIALFTPPLHHQGKHFHLALGKTEVGRRDPLPRARVPLLRRGATEGFGRNVDAARKYQPQRIHHDVAGSRFRNEAQRAEIESFDDGLAIVEGRQHHQGNRRVTLAQISKYPSKPSRSGRFKSSRIR